MMKVAEALGMGHARESAASVAGLPDSSALGYGSKDQGSVAHSKHTVHDDE